MSEIADLAKQLEADLMQQYGPMLSGSALLCALGYRSQDAFRQACLRGTVPVSVFSIQHRRGRYALSRDVAHWIAQQRLGASVNNGRRPEEEKKEVQASRHEPQYQEV